MAPGFDKGSDGTEEGVTAWVVPRAEKGSDRTEEGVTG